MRVPRWGARLAGSSSLLLSLALVHLAVAAALPPVAATRRIYDYVFAFDITQSSYVVDMSLNGTPVSRLTFAKAAARAALTMPCRAGLG